MLSTPVYSLRGDICVLCVCLLPAVELRNTELQAHPGEYTGKAERTEVKGQQTCACTLASYTRCVCLCAFVQLSKNAIRLVSFGGTLYQPLDVSDTHTHTHTHTRTHAHTHTHTETQGNTRTQAYRHNMAGLHTAMKAAQPPPTHTHTYIHTCTPSTPTLHIT